jgi:3-dehydroquinate synthase
MNSFKIDNTFFNISKELPKDILIKSHPTNYKVSFKEFTNSFNEDDVILVDSKVKSLYNITHNKLIEIEATEHNKSIETVLNVCENLLEYNFNKKNNLIVIGGGIIQDIGAFTSKMYKRGINWIFYPTTLLSQCDSCIGGKTALNFKHYKNQLALFSSPKEVIIDTNFLNTLQPEDITSGYGEIVKLFLTGGDYYIDNLNEWSIEEKIKHSLLIKKAVVEYDEFELCERKSLNYGHSFGHVIEPLTNYKIPHGEAVLLGIEIINKLFDNNPKISNVINQFTDLNKISHLDFDKLTMGLLSDKKVSGNNISFVRVPHPGTTIFTNTEINKDLKAKVNELFTN